MTDSNFCCLCASDEGIFLDIFTATDRQLGNRSFLKEFETCLSVKVKRDESLSTKICHRCAIELGECNKFVEKYHRIYEATLKQKKNLLKKSCCLCLSTDENNYLFTLAKDFRSTVDPLQKIYECFNRQITREEAERRSICLLCRYNLDVLFDLKKLASEVTSKLHKIAESKAILANLPKTKTFVVSRKTTIIYQSKPDLEAISESESNSDSTNMARKRTRTKKLVGGLKSAVELKLRTCGQCNTSIEGGTDMYRLHSTGITVCKMCWITMDPFNPSRSGKRKLQNQTEAKSTRLCAVFLRDVLSPASSKNNERSLLQFEKEEEEEEEEEKKDEIFVISDDSSDNEAQVIARSKENLRKRGANKSSGESDTNLKPKLKRSSKQEEMLLTHNTPKKKLKSSKNEDVIIVPLTPRRSARYQSSDSDSVKAKNKRNDVLDIKNDGRKEVGKKVKATVGHWNTENKLNKPKSNNKDEGKRKGRVNAEIEMDIESVESKSEDSSSPGSGGIGNRKSRKVRNKVPLIIKPKLQEKSSNKGETKSAITPSKSPTVSKNSRLNSKVKIHPKKSKTLMMVSFPFKLKDPYECKVCRTEYRNKIVGMKHELTHFKQVEIKIEKLNINHRHHNFQTTTTTTTTNNQNSTTTKLPDESCSPDLISTNEKPLQSEIPTSSTSPHESDEDQSKLPDRKIEEEKAIQSSVESSQTIEKDDKTADIDVSKETEAVSSSNELLEEESTPLINESKIETAENDVVAELAAETKGALKKVEEFTPEADSMTETNVKDLNDAVKLVKEIVDDDKEEGDKREEEEEEEEVDEVLKKTINDIEAKINTENKSDEEEREEKREKEEGDDSNSSKTPVDKDEEKARESNEEIESDTDIRIVDTGSSAEDSREQTEKCPNQNDETNVAKNDSDEKGSDEKSTESKEDLKVNNDDDDDDENKDISNNEPDHADITSTICSENNDDLKSKSNGVSSENETETNKNENEKDCATTSEDESSQKIEEKARSQNDVTEILQEVMDLATAEVQKRIESDVTSVPETLENISEEINKTGEGSLAVDEMASGVGDTKSNKETESCKLI